MRLAARRSGGWFRVLCPMKRCGVSLRRALDDQGVLVFPDIDLDWEKQQYLIELVVGSADRPEEAFVNEEDKNIAFVSNREPCPSFPTGGSSGIPTQCGLTGCRTPSPCTDWKSRRTWRPPSSPARFTPGRPPASGPAHPGLRPLGDPRGGAAETCRGRSRAVSLQPRVLTQRDCTGGVAPPQHRQDDALCQRAADPGARGFPLRRRRRTSRSPYRRISTAPSTSTSTIGDRTTSWCGTTWWSNTHAGTSLSTAPCAPCGRWRRHRPGCALACRRSPGWSRSRLDATAPRCVGLPGCRRARRRGTPCRRRLPAASEVSQRRERVALRAEALSRWSP